MHQSSSQKNNSPFQLLESLCTHTVGFFIWSILCFTLLAFVVCIFVFCVKHQDVFSVAEIIWFIPATALLLLISKLAQFIQTRSERFATCLMIALEAVIAIIMITSYDTQPCSDYASIWQSANEIAQGRFSAGTDPTQYMYFYNWQLGIAVFEAFFIKFGATFFTLKVLNAILLIAIQHIEYRLVKQKLGFQTACTAYALSALFMPWCLTIPQFTNHHIGTIFLLMSLQLLEEQTPSRWAFAGVLLAMMNLLRPIGIIVLLTAVCYTIYLIIQRRHIKPLVLLIVLIASYSLVLTCFDSVLISAGYTDSPVSHARLPYFKFQKGLYGYNWPLTDLNAYHYNYDEYNAAMKIELIEHISTHPLETLVFVANKMIRYLGLFDYQFEMTYNHDVAFYTQYPVRALYSTSWFQYIGICLLAIKGYPSYARRYPVDIYQVFFIGNTLVYLLIEAFSSYRFESYPFLIMLAALGMNHYQKAEKPIPHQYKRTAHLTFED